MRIGNICFDELELFRATDDDESCVLDEEAEKLRSSSLSGWSWLPLDDDHEYNKSLYMCVTSYDIYARSFSFRWYTIDFKDCNPCPECCTTLSPVFETMPPRLPDSFTAVAFGSRIYIIGGYSRCSNIIDGVSKCCTIFHDTVFYYDTAHPHQGWKEGPSMIRARCEPSVIVVHGKMYVFGSMDIKLFGDADINHLGYKKQLPYAEVLDSTLDRWEELPEPLMEDLPNILESAHALLSDDCGNRHILIHPRNTKVFLSYNIDTRAWGLFDERFGKGWSGAGGMGAAVDGVLYCCIGCNVYGYDLLKRKRFTSPVKGFEECKDSFRPDYNYYEPGAHLFHIGGGKLCLFWASIHVTAFCTIFTVERHDDEPLSDGGEPYLVARVESVKRYYADAYRCEAEYCIAL